MLGYFHCGTKKVESVAVPGSTEYDSQLYGDRTGKDWIPAEADVSIRPDWLYHGGHSVSLVIPWTPIALGMLGAIAVCLTAAIVPALSAGLKDLLRIFQQAQREM